MNKHILKFIKEMKDKTGGSWLYSVSTWEHGHMLETITIHRIFSCIQGFKGVEKDTEEELIATLDLVREQVRMLLSAQEIQKQIDIKLIGNI